MSDPVEVKEKPKGLLSDPVGDWSSKRFFGIASFLVAVVIAFVMKDATLTGVFMGAASAVFIAQAVSKT